MLFCNNFIRPHTYSIETRSLHWHHYSCLPWTRSTCWWPHQSPGCFRLLVFQRPVRDSAMGRGKCNIFMKESKFGELSIQYVAGQIHHSENVISVKRKGAIPSAQDPSLLTNTSPISISNSVLKPISPTIVHPSADTRCPMKPSEHCMPCVWSHCHEQTSQVLYE
ncbi:hypothetical protein CY34DRAFT_203275 [Suillus luteus UH-Slu-Lm8-n1]|uniref:Uncharacterized protein n=1 Tax=Suillus luteus UH-Slu-Lm8-n1 TaxID=930992 RepID=A0A0D0AHZ4_9AGAM|nr:hypothetical protein CY34DRAFT_203275 [Suillus luteus UH-Slu-Lm8-n1]